MVTPAGASHFYLEVIAEVHHKTTVTDGWHKTRAVCVVQCDQIDVWGWLYFNGELKDHKHALTIATPTVEVTTKGGCGVGNWAAATEGRALEDGVSEWLYTDQSSWGGATCGDEGAVGEPASPSSWFELNDLAARVRTAAGLSADWPVRMLTDFDLGMVRPGDTRAYSELVGALNHFKRNHHRVGDLMPVLWVVGNERVGAAILHRGGALTMVELDWNQGTWQMLFVKTLSLH